MRPLKILRLVLPFILSLSPSHAGVQARDAPPSARPLPSHDGLINRAYLDAAAVLSEENECSRFFGGPYAATTVLKRLAGQLRATRLAPGVGRGMCGRVTDSEAPSPASRYPLFEKAVVNVAAPFSSRQDLAGAQPVRNVGS